ncbi:zinc-ribbon domain containing protein [Candidatus Berkelbacteria bacterium]|nr:zinc-ribbon domain containing protein [Candidatus Berkelbacteria bacterium]
MAEDQTLTCRDCNENFVWSSGEQEFYAQKGLSQPTRCKACRAKKKAMRDAERSGAVERKMYDITCSNCGNPGQVPFEPKTDTVLCRECFMAQRAAQDPQA